MATDVITILPQPKLKLATCRSLPWISPYQEDYRSDCAKKMGKYNCDLLIDSSNNELDLPYLANSLIEAHSDTDVYSLVSNSRFMRKQSDSCCDTSSNSDQNCDKSSPKSSVKHKQKCEGHVHCTCDLPDLLTSLCDFYDLHLSSSQISRLLVVEPEKRITAKDALAHAFFKREENTPNTFSSSLVAPFQREERKFYPRRLFKAAVITVIAMNKIRLLRLNPPPISLENVRKDPYGIKTFRKIIDAGAFKIYGHWVKRGENQNRAALFENTPKSELRNHERQNTLQVLEFEVKGRVGRQPLKLIIGDTDSFDDN